MAQYKQSATYTRKFLMVLSSDHLTGATGLTVTVTLSKAGATSFSAAAGTVSEVGNGWYNIALTTADTNTLGELAFHCTAATADATDFVDQVALFDPIGGVVPTVTTVTNQLTAAAIAAGVWQDATAGDFTVANSIGKSLYTGVAPGATNGITISSELANDYQQRGQPVTLSAADSLTMSSGTATAGTANTITLQTALGHDGFGVGCRIKITSGTGANQSTTITGYVNSTLVATVFPAWTVTPDATSVYAIAWDIDPKTTVWSQAMVELSAVPAVTDTILKGLEWLFILGHNKITETASTQLVRNNADNATIGSSSASDDGTTFIRGAYS